MILLDQAPVYPPPPHLPYAPAEEIAALHNANGGASYSLVSGDIAGQPGYAVSIYPRRERILPYRFLSHRQVRTFIRDNWDLLSDPSLGVVVGTWFNPEAGRTHLDVSAHVQDREVAETVGKASKQIAIYDLERFETITLSY